MCKSFVYASKTTEMITKTHILYNNHRHHRYIHQAGRPAPPYLPLMENGQLRELAARWRRDDRLRQAVARERPRYAAGNAHY